MLGNLKHVKWEMRQAVREKIGLEIRMWEGLPSGFINRNVSTEDTGRALGLTDIGGLERQEP